MKSTERSAASIWLLKPSGEFAPLVLANEQFLGGREKPRGRKTLPFNDTWN